MPPRKYYVLIVCSTAPTNGHPGNQQQPHYSERLCTRISHLNVKTELPAETDTRHEQEGYIVMHKSCDPARSRRYRREDRDMTENNSGEGEREERTARTRIVIARRESDVCRLKTLRSGGRLGSACTSRGPWRVRHRLGMRSIVSGVQTRKGAALRSGLAAREARQC